MCRDHKKKTENKKDVMCSDLPRICIWFRAGNYTKKNVPISREKGSLHCKNRRKFLTFIVYLLSVYRIDDNIKLKYKLSKQNNAQYIKT